MKNLIPFILVLLAAVILLASCGGQPDAALHGEKEDAVMQKPFPEKILVDGEALTLEEGKTEYEYLIPDGDPYIPKVEASAGEGTEVTVRDGYIPRGQNEGRAEIVLKKDGSEQTFSVIFRKDAEKGVVLQYGGTYVFDCGEGAVYSSSASEYVKVDENGVVRAKDVTDSPVTITAVKDGETKTLVIDRVLRARVDLIFTAGQSTAQGCYDTSDKTGKRIPTSEQHALIERIGDEGLSFGFDIFPRSENTQVYSLKGHLYDRGLHLKQGYENSIALALLENCGEKTLFVSSAYSGAPIEAWLDPDEDEDAGPYGSHYLYSKLKSGYKVLEREIAKHFEIERRLCFWWQGGTGMSYVYSREKGGWIKPSDPDFNVKDRITDEKYYEYFLRVRDNFKEDFGVERFFLIPARCTPSVCSSENVKLGIYVDLSPVRTAHYRLCNEVEDVTMVSRLVDCMRPYSSPDKTSEGYGYIGVDNTHSNQIGYNALGRDIGNNIFEYYHAKPSAESVEMIASDGRTRFAHGETLPMKISESKRIAAKSLPFMCDEKLTFVSSDDSVAKVSGFGCVEAVGKGTCRVTAKTAGGHEEYIVIAVTG